uniref:Uncharacterized protein n=1 Tax=Anguilla anguilla TaxID=7936 RepID=A0A0E9V1P1_ANGAN
MRCFSVGHSSCGQWDSCDAVQTVYRIHISQALVVFNPSTKSSCKILF